MSIKWISTRLFVLLLLIIGTPAAAFELSHTHIAVNLASYHHNASRTFNERNPGLGLGATFALPSINAETTFEAGAYYNSIETTSYYVTGSTDFQVAEMGSAAALRLGAFTGFAHYPEEALKFAGSGVPSIGNWVIVGGAQATLRVNNRHDLRVRVIPAGSVADAIFTFQIATHF